MIVMTDASPEIRETEVGGKNNVSVRFRVSRWSSREPQNTRGRGSRNGRLGGSGGTRMGTYMYRSYNLARCHKITDGPVYPIRSNRYFKLLSMDENPDLESICVPGHCSLFHRVVYLSEELYAGTDYDQIPTLPDRS